MFNLWVCQCVIMKNCFPGDNYCSGNYHKSTSECFGRCLYVCLCTDFVNTAVSQSYSIKLQRFTDVMLSSKRRQELKMCVVWPIEGLPGAMTASQNTTFFLSLNMFVAPWLSVFYMKVWYLLVTADVVLTLLYLSLCVRLRVCVCVSLWQNVVVKTMLQKPPQRHFLVLRQVFVCVSVDRFCQNDSHNSAICSCKIL